MKKTTVVSLCILFFLLCSLIGFSIGSPSLWTKYFSHWIVPSSIAFIMTLLVGLVLMDDLFELDSPIVITLRHPPLRIKIERFLIWAFLMVCTASIVLEMTQFMLSQGNVSLRDPLTIIAGSALGIIIHIAGSRVLMKRVEFELERWEDNVL